MKKLITIIFFLASAALYGQNDRVYSAAEINTINTTNAALEGDLYYDAGSDILYIGLMDGTLVSINDTDNQTIDVSTFTAGGLLNLSLQRDGEAPKVIPLISTTSGNDLSFNANGLFINETDDQTLSFNNADADDGVNTLTIEGHPAINIDDNHLGTNDQTLTTARDINLSGNNLFVNSTDGFAQFTPTGNIILRDDSSPYIETYDNTNVVRTRFQSSNSFGSVGTASNHYLRFITNNSEVGRFHTDGQFQLTGYGSAAFTGTMTNVLGVDVNGDVIEVDPASLNTDEQSIDLNTHTALGINLSLTNDATTATVPLISSTANNDLSFDTDGLFINETDEQDLSLSGNTLSLTNDATTVDLSPYLDNTDDQTLTYTNTDADDNINTLQIEGSPVFNIDDNHLGTNNQSLTANRDIFQNGNNLRMNTANGIINFNSFGQVLMDNSNTPLLQLTDMTNTVRTQLYSEDTFGATGTFSDHPFQIRANGNVRLTVNTDGSLRFHHYNAGSFTGTLNNLLGVTATGDVIEVDPSSIGTDDQTLTFLNTDPDDGVNSLTIEGHPAINIDDNHLGTNDQILSANRTVDMNNNDLLFDATQDVIIEAGGNVGIGTSSPATRLDVDNGSVRFSDYGVGTYLDTLATVGDAVYHLAVDAQGDVVETNTVKAAKIFYPPAIVIDVSAITTGNSLDLYQEYLDRFGSPTLSSPSAPSAIPTYQRDELYYYVTDYDTSVFANTALDDNGNFDYDVSTIPSGNCTFINVVFVVK